MSFKKIMSVVLAGAMALSLAACGSTGNASADNAEKTFKVGICNYVDDASLNQIVENIESQLDAIGKEKNVKFEISEQNCMADASIMDQIISQFIADDVDLMVGIATPVAMAMQAATEDNKIPVVFAAVSDPVACGVVDSLDKPGANITGTSDYLDTNAVMNLIFAQNPDAKNIALLYDQGQDSSTTAINDAKAYLDKKGVSYKAYTGTNADEVLLAAQAIVADKCDAAFTPSDNTIMAAELGIYETLMEGNVLHYTGADSFALNGAFLGYGVDYANLGCETANMIAKILIDGADPATTAVMTFDNGTATVNTDVCKALNLKFEDIEKTFAPYCTKVQEITTREEF